MEVPPLSVIIPCRDEEANIAYCIASVAGLAAEIIVADNGSTDGTLAVAHELGCRIIEREFVGYANFKNWAIPQAKHPWVLILDADERVTPALAQEIRELFARQPKCDAYRMLRRDVFFRHPVRFCGSADHRITRLIRRDVCRYKERLVHEEIDNDGLKIGNLQGRLLHFTAPTLAGWTAKQVRYGMLGGEEEFAAGKKCGYWRLLTHAPLRFLVLYLLRGGFRDGYAGLVVCVIAAFYTFLKDARLWELNQLQAALPTPLEEFPLPNCDLQTVPETRAVNSRRYLHPAPTRVSSENQYHWPALTAVGGASQ